MTDVERDRDPDGAVFFKGAAFVGREMLAVARCTSATFLLLAVGLGLGFAGTEVEAEAAAGVALVFGLYKSSICNMFSKKKKAHLCFLLLFWGGACGRRRYDTSRMFCPFLASSGGSGWWH